MGVGCPPPKKRARPRKGLKGGEKKEGSAQTGPEGEAKKRRD